MRGNGGRIGPKHTPTTGSASGVWSLAEAGDNQRQSLWPPLVGALYTFTTATFTPGTATGRTGPDLTTARTGLTGTGVDAWKNNTSYFNMTTQGIQIWTVPENGTYRFDVAGASGGWDTSRNKDCSRIGLGGRYQFDIVLSQGSQIQIVVGQSGGNTSSSSYLGGGGGGGTFVFTGSRGGGGLIVAAGGGGGAGSTGSYTPANGGGPAAGVNGNFAGTSGSAGLCDASYDGNPGPGGTSGAGGQSGGSGWASTENTGGGAGWVSDGQPNPEISTQVSAVRGTGFIGGSLSSSNVGAVGGFGGGGATSFTGGSFAGGGGGGGYSGGGGAGWNANAGACVANSSGSGGGGGGFAIATAINPTSTSGFREGHGYVSVTKL